MKVESQRGRVLGGSNWTEESRDAEEKGRKGIKLTSSLKCKRSTEIFRVSQLLPVIYQGFCQYSGSVTPTGKEGRKVEMWKRTEESISKYKESIYIGTSTGSTRFGQRNAGQS